MPFRFHRSIRIGPGLRLNVSKSGVSESLGGRGAWFTIGPRGTRATVGLPGTGLSYSEQRKGAAGWLGVALVIMMLAALVVVFAPLIAR